MEDKRKRNVRFGIYPEDIERFKQRKVTKRLIHYSVGNDSLLIFFTWNGVPYEIGVTHCEIGRSRAIGHQFIAFGLDFLAIGSAQLLHKSQEAEILASELGFACFADLIEDRRKRPNGLPFIGYLLEFAPVEFTPTEKV